MITRKSGMILLLNIAVLCSGLSGCASHRVNLIDQGIVAAKRAELERICVARAHVYRDGDELVISGKVKCTRFRGFSILSCPAGLKQGA